MSRLPKFAVGASLLYEGRVPVRVVAVLDGCPFDEPCYWVADASGRWVCSESWLSCAGVSA